MNCAQITEDGGISVEELLAFNSWIGSDCDSGLHANLAENAERAVCIRSNSSAPIITPSGSTPSTTAPTKTATLPTGPTQTGIVSGCMRFYTVSEGDTCANVYGRFGLTFEQFYAWNPAGQSFTAGFSYANEVILTSNSGSQM